MSYKEKGQHKKMNTTSDEAAAAGGLLGSKEIGGFGYGIGVSVGILLLITSITLASYFCTRSHQQPPPPPPRRHLLLRRRHHRNHHRHGGTPSSDRSDSVAVDVFGLDEETIKSYPKMRFSETTKSKMKNEGNTTSRCCSICLADYEAADTLRQLPECCHVFHANCIDPWLRLHPTCPVCRTSPIPTPLSTPLAEVVPLASSRH